MTDSMEMSWDYTPTVTDIEEVKDGFRKLTEGHYHVYVVEVKPHKSNDKNMAIVVLKTLAGTMKDCFDIKHSLFFVQGNEWAYKDILRLCIATGLTTDQQLTQYAQEGKAIHIGDFLQSLPGKQFCMQLKKDKKGELRATYFGTDSEESVDIPKDMNAYNLLKTQAEADANAQQLQF